MKKRLLWLLRGKPVPPVIINATTTSKALAETATKHEEAISKADRLLANPQLKALVEDYRRMDQAIRRNR